MKMVTAAEANRNFAKLMREAREGETIVVTAHGVPLVTIDRFKDDDKDRVAARLAGWEALWARIDQQPAQPASWKFNRDELYDD